MPMPHRELVCTGLDLSFWEWVKPMLSRAIEMNRGEFTLADIYQRIQDRDMQLWGIHNGEIKACFVTEVIQYPRKKYVRGVILGGDNMENWLQLMADSMDEFARQQGANGVELLGRRGWVKALKKHGYSEYETVISKEL